MVLKRRLLRELRLLQSVLFLKMQALDGGIGVGGGEGGVGEGGGEGGGDGDGVGVGGHFPVPQSAPHMITGPIPCGKDTVQSQSPSKPSYGAVRGHHR